MWKIRWNMIWHPFNGLSQYDKMTYAVIIYRYMTNVLLMQYHMTWHMLYWCDSHPYTRYISVMTHYHMTPLYWCDLKIWLDTCCISEMSHDMEPVVWALCHMILHLLCGHDVTCYETCCLVKVSPDMTPVVWTWCQRIWHLLHGRDVTWYDTCCVGMMSHDMTPAVWAWYHNHMTLVLQLWCHNHVTCSKAVMS